MGNKCYFGKKEQCKIMMTGIDLSSLLDIPIHIKGLDYEKKLIVCGPLVQTFEYRNLLINTFDWNRVSDKVLMMKTSKEYFENNTGIVYVVASDFHCWQDDDTQTKILEEILNDELNKGLPLLIIANRKEQKNAQNLEKICELLQVEKIKDRKWKIVQTISTSKKDLELALDWMSDSIKGT